MITVCTKVYEIVVSLFMQHKRWFITMIIKCNWSENVYHGVNMCKIDTLYIIIFSRNLNILHALSG